MAHDIAQKANPETCLDVLIQGSYASSKSYRRFDPSNGNITKSNVCQAQLYPYSAMFVSVNSDSGRKKGFDK
jgi:hypothetical protein